jgi:hypothetical protein
VTGGPAVAPHAGQVTWVDFDNDGDLDLIITSAASASPCRVFRNDGAGAFTELTNTGLEKATFSTGIAWGDYDNDGLPDVFICRLNSSFSQPLPSFLFHNNGNGTFTQIEQKPFTTDTGYAPSCAWADYDNDGWLDLFVTNFGNGGKNRLYHNNHDGTFTRVTSGSIANDLGSSAGCAWGDYDRDGFLDLFVANAIVGGGSSTDFLYHNDGNTNAWLTIKCVGSRSNRSAIGTKLHLKATIGGESLLQTREINTGHGLAQSALEAHFGLGDATDVENLRIEWPSGTVQEFQNVSAKQHLTITEPAQLEAGTNGGLTEFYLHGGRNLQWNIEMTTNLVNWSLLSTVLITSLDGRITITDPNPATSQRYYRAISK